MTEGEYPGRILYDAEGRPAARIIDLADVPLPDYRKPPEPKRRPSFARLCRAEPRILPLYEEACAVKDDGSRRYFCAHEHFYGFGGFKQRLSELVGNQRRDHPVLATRAAYDVVYERIYKVLPPCRGNCLCYWPER
jgi:hypothetical protein